MTKDDPTDVSGGSPDRLSLPYWQAYPPGMDNIAVRSRSMRRISTNKARTVFGFIIAASVLYPPSFGAADEAKTAVLRDFQSGFSFRYDRSIWHEEEPQYSNTLALLYADDGSLATCNVNADPRKELANLSFEATNLFNGTNHKEETLSQNQKRVMSDVVVHDYSRGVFGLGYNGGILTYSGYPKNIPNMLAKGIAGSVFAQGYWIIVVCHQPVSQRTDLPETAQAGFDMIKGTLLHTER